MNTCTKGFGTSALICLLTVISQGSALASTSLTHAPWASQNNDITIQGLYESSSIQQIYSEDPDMSGRGNPESTQPGNTR